MERSIESSKLMAVSSWQRSQDELEGHPILFYYQHCVSSKEVTAIIKARSSITIATSTAEKQ